MRYFRIGFFAFVIIIPSPILMVWALVAIDRTSENLSFDVRALCNSNVKMISFYAGAFCSEENIECPTMNAILDAVYLSLDANVDPALTRVKTRIDRRYQKIVEHELAGLTLCEPSDQSKNLQVQEFFEFVFSDE